MRSAIVVITMSDSQKFANAVVAYFAFFGSRFVGNDIQVTLGGLLDTPVAKTFSLMAIMYQATQNARIALICSAVAMIAHYLVSVSPWGGPYKDKVSAKHVDIRGQFWPSISRGAQPATVQVPH